MPPPELNYATVHKTREKGRVVKVDFRVVFGTVAAVTAALASSLVSNKINTAFVERQNGTDRNRNGRKVRKTYCFSKDWNVHEAVTYFTMYTYNFCSPGANTPCPDVRWPLGPSFSRHGRRTGRPCLVSPRMASLPSRATRVGHKVILAAVINPFVCAGEGIRRATSMQLAIQGDVGQVLALFDREPNRRLPRLGGPRRGLLTLCHRGRISVVAWS